MSTHEGYSIEISSAYGQMWRYNIEVAGGCFDANGQRTHFVSSHDKVADVAATTTKPALIPAERRVVLAAPACHRMLAYVYIIPHTLPADDEPEKPFDTTIRVMRGRTVIYEHVFGVNAWGGLSLELHVQGSDVAAAKK